MGFHDSIGEEGQGGIPTAPAKSQHSPHSQREVIGASREGVLKAFNDPKTMEVRNVTARWSKGIRCKCWILRCPR